MTLPLLLATNVRALRLQQGLTQAELATRAGLTVESVARLERILRGASSANGNPCLSTLEALAAALDVEVTDLLAKKQPKQTGKSRGAMLSFSVNGLPERQRQAIVRVVELAIRGAGK